MEKEIMVKVCSKCGIVNTERAEECESCGAELGVSVKESEANKLCKQIAKRNKKIKNAIAAEKFGGLEKDPVNIPVTPGRIVLGVIGCIAAVCEVVLMVLSGWLSPENGDTMIAIGFCTLVLLAIGILHCFLPTEMWMFAHCFDHLYYKETPAPSDTGLKFQIASIVLLILLSVASIVFQIAFFFVLQ